MDDRKLTPAEEKQKAAFLSLSAKMEQQGYRRTDLCLSASKTNTMAFVTTAPFLLLGIYLFSRKNGEIPSSFFNSWHALPFLLSLLVGIVIHEWIHGVTWSLFTKKGVRSIQFGFIAKHLTPYCTCDEALPFWGYVTGALMPTLILGVGVYLVGLFTDQYSAALWGLFNILAGGGDLAIIWRIRHHRKSLLLDHPYDVGCIAFDK